MITYFDFIDNIDKNIIYCLDQWFLEFYGPIACPAKVKSRACNASNIDMNLRIGQPCSPRRLSVELSKRELSIDMAMWIAPGKFRSPIYEKVLMAKYYLIYVANFESPSVHWLLEFFCGFLNFPWAKRDSFFHSCVHCPRLIFPWLGFYSTLCLVSWWEGALFWWRIFVPCLATKWFKL